MSSNQRRHNAGAFAWGFIAVVLAACLVWIGFATGYGVGKSDVPPVRCPAVVAAPHSYGTPPPKHTIPPRPTGVPIPKETTK